MTQVRSLQKIKGNHSPGNPHAPFIQVGHYNACEYTKPIHLNPNFSRGLPGITYMWHNETLRLLRMRIGHRVELPFWQTDWHGIAFSKLGVKLSATRLASAEFYTAFYKSLLSKYQDYCDLPEHWLKVKKTTAEAIAKEIAPHASILSYGCGLGYIEKELCSMRKDVHISAFDFADNASSLMKPLPSEISFISHLANDSKFDLVYLCQVLYAIPFLEGIALLSKLRCHLKENGVIILIGSSIDSAENGDFFSDHSWRILDLAKPYIYFFFGWIKNDTQFWGWKRNNARHEEMLCRAGFRVIKSYTAAKQSFIVAL